jgi:hypothetical protein
MMYATGTQTALGDGKTGSLADNDVRHGHAYVDKVDLTMTT